MAVIGFVGLGIMGRDMALNLLRAGHRVLAHDVRPEAVAPLVAAGAETAPTLMQAAEPADAVVTMLPDTPQVEEVVHGPGGLLAYPPRGGIILELITFELESM